MGRRPLVVVTDYLNESRHESEVLGDVADLLLLQAQDDGALLKRGTDAKALIVFHDIQITERSLSRLDQLLGVVRVGVGYDNVDLKAAGERGIRVCNVPDYGTEDVADHALLMMLALARRLEECSSSVRGGAWEPSVIFGAPRMRGKTLGIIGCGRIGTAMALRAKALGMDVVFYDPFQPPGYEKGIGVRRAWTIEELLPQSPFVSVHCPLTDETRGILNERTLSLLPQGSIVVNTARGPCVDAEALLKALDSGRVRAAGLDVVEREPLDDDRLRRHPRLLLTPHIAFYSAEGYAEMRTKAAQEVYRLLTGAPVRNLVNGPYLVNARAAAH